MVSLLSPGGQVQPLMCCGGWWVGKEGGEGDQKSRRLRVTEGHTSEWQGILLNGRVVFDHSVLLIVWMLRLCSDLLSPAKTPFACFSHIFDVLLGLITYQDWQFCDKVFLIFFKI